MIIITSIIIIIIIIIIVIIICSYSPSHRRGTLKGVPTVKSFQSHFKVT